jgi:hypothetical protein
MIVEDTFNLQGRLLLVPGIRRGVAPRHDQTFEIIHPDGSKLTSEAWIEWPRPKPDGVYLLGLPGLAKHEALQGTEVWLTEDGKQRPRVKQGRRESREIAAVGRQITVGVLCGSRLA